MRIQKSALLISALVLAATTAYAGQPKTMEQAQYKAAHTGRPILMKVGTEWCKACNKFDKAVAKNDELRQTIQSEAIFLHVDAEKGEGPDLAQAYGVEHFPTFLLVNAEGELMDRWGGFYAAEKFEKQLVAAAADAMPVSERLAQFRAEPTEHDARKLGDLQLDEGHPAEAAAYYARAASLNPHSETDYQLRIFGAMARGAYSQLYSAGDLAEQANVVVSNPDASEKALWEVNWQMRKVASKLGETEMWHPYLQAAFERTEADGVYAEKRAYLEADYALHIQGDERKALGIKRATLEGDGLNDANTLNNFAWWCFENRVNVAEATEMAKRGVDLAKAGAEKANVLDTLAELCNLNRDCANAVEYIRLAIEEDPKNEYFQSQLTRFEEILAMQD